ncbi:hypothetical protein [Lederbergia ruris]|uniref:hypothetical protein n=1 Tax=Lederbergia ruris TaxID=217495 RepID=UPI0039A21E7D
MNKEWIQQNLRRSLLSSIVYEKRSEKIQSYISKTISGDLNELAYREIGRILFVYQLDRFFKATSYYLTNSDSLRYSQMDNLEQQWFLQKQYQDPEKQYMANWVKDTVIPFFKSVMERLNIGTEMNFDKFIEILEAVDSSINLINEDYEMADTWIYDTFHILKSDIEHYRLMQDEYEEHPSIVLNSLETHSNITKVVTHYSNEYRSISNSQYHFSRIANIQRRVGNMENEFSEKIGLISPATNRYSISFDSIETVN